MEAKLVSFHHVVGGTMWSLLAKTFYIFITKLQLTKDCKRPQRPRRLESDHVEWCPKTGKSFPLKYVFICTMLKSSRKWPFSQNQGPVIRVTKFLSWTFLGWGLIRAQWVLMTSQSLGCHKGISLTNEGPEHGDIVGGCDCWCLERPSPAEQSSRADWSPNQPTSCQERKTMGAPIRLKPIL